MGMSTHIVGYRPADPEWEKMLAVYSSCKEADISIPSEVVKFFDYEDPTGQPGMEVNLDEACSDYSEDMIDGYQIDLSLLPKGVKFIRFYNSY